MKRPDPITIITPRIIIESILSENIVTPIIDQIPIGDKKKVVLQMPLQLVEFLPLGNEN